MTYEPQEPDAEESQPLRDFSDIIAEADAPRYAVITCKRLNCRLRICTLRPEAEIEVLDDFQAWNAGVNKTHKQLRSIKVKAISKAIVNDDGTRIYDTQEGRKLLASKLDMSSLEQIADQVLTHCGLDNLKGEVEDAVDEAKKN